jgi:hypothetical protein
MSTHPDLDRTTRAWLDLMPDEVPDRVIDAVLEAVERTPQVRRPFGVPVVRLLPMPRPVMAAGLFAILVIAVLGATSLISSPSKFNGAAGPPTPSAPATATAAPSGTTSATTPTATVPTSLQHEWVAAPLADSLSGAVTRRSMTFSELGLEIRGSSIAAGMLRASVAGDASTLTLTSDNGGICPAGATAKVGWSLSAGGGVLTLNRGQDPCAERSALLVGPWYRVNCSDPGDTCLGALDPGTYASQFIEPRPSSSAWSARWGALTYTVPSGWANYADWPSRFGLTNAYSTYTADGAPLGGISELDVWAQPAAVADPASCGTPPALDHQVGPSPAALVNWLRTVKGLTTTTPQQVTVGTMSGLRLQVSVSAGRGKVCSGDPVGGLTLFEDWATGGVWANGGWVLGIAEGERMEMTFLDIGQGAVVIEAADVSGDSAALNALSALGRPIFESMQFH